MLFKTHSIIYFECLVREESMTKNGDSGKNRWNMSASNDYRWTKKLQMEGFCRELSSQKNPKWHFMANPKKNSVFVHEVFEKWPIRLLEKTNLKWKLKIKREVLNEHCLWKNSYPGLLKNMPLYRWLVWRKIKNILLFVLST